MRNMKACNPTTLEFASAAFGGSTRLRNFGSVCFSRFSPFMFRIACILFLFHLSSDSLGTVYVRVYVKNTTPSSQSFYYQNNGIDVPGGPQTLSGNGGTTSSRGPAEPGDVLSVRGDTDTQGALPSGGT